jgi:hypothetical protein
MLALPPIGVITRRAAYFVQAATGTLPPPGPVLSESRRAGFKMHPLQGDGSKALIGEGQTRFRLRSANP